MNARRISSGWALLLYWFALTTATHWPIQVNLTTAGGVELDSLIHGLSYAPLLWLVVGFLAFRPAEGSAWREHRLIVAIAMVLTWAVIDELTQPPFGRTASVFDWLGDATGTLLAAGVVLALRASNRRLSRSAG